MRIVTLSLVALALAGCHKTDVTNTAANEALANDMAIENMAGTVDNTATPAAFSINETSWEYVDPKTKKAVQESVDASGNYVTWAGAEHVDHGTAVTKDGKACFTSAMNKDGEMCWTDPKLEPGASGETVSDKGDHLPIKRIAFMAVPANVAP